MSWVNLVYYKSNKLINYVSPTILLSSIAMIVWFSRLKLKGTIISKLSPLAFGIYLFQLNQVIWNSVIKGKFAFVAQMSVVKGVFLSLCFADLCVRLDCGVHQACHCEMDQNPPTEQTHCDAVQFDHNKDWFPPEVMDHMEAMLVLAKKRRTSSIGIYVLL